MIASIIIFAVEILIPIIFSIGAVSSKASEFGVLPTYMYFIIYALCVMGGIGCIVWNALHIRRNKAKGITGLVFSIVDVVTGIIFLALGAFLLILIIAIISSFK